MPTEEGPYRPIRISRENYINIIQIDLPGGSTKISMFISDMPPGTDCPYPIRILAFFKMIRPHHVVIRI